MPMKTMLDVTTGHLKKQDREALQRLADRQRVDNWPTPHVYQQQYGWYISAGVMYGNDVADGQEELRLAGFSEEFIALMTHAYENDVAIVNFDADGYQEPGFKLFDEDTDEEILDEEPTLRA